MRCIDLTHPLHSGSPVFPGTDPPRFDRVATLEEAGHVETRIVMHTHTGTHMDAPAHMLADGATLDQYDPSAFYGPSVVVDVTDHEGPLVGVDALLPRAGDIEAADFVLFRTGWSSRWGTEAYFGGFPAPSPAAARWLLDRQIKGVGTDAISVDPMESTEYPVHHTLMGAGALIVENLTNLDKISASGAHLACFPLAIERADGSPVRAVAIAGR